MILAVVTTALGAIAAAVGSIVVHNAQTPWWTIVPASVSAVGTCSAFGVTYALFRRDQQERVREQANRIYAWEERDEQDDGTVLVTGTVYNRSDQPVWRVELRPRSSDQVFRDDLYQPYCDIKPGDHETWTWTIPPEKVASLERHPRLRFHDASGRRWQRVGRELRPLAPRHPTAD